MPQDNKSLCDEITFSKVFREYSKTLYNYLYYKCGNEELAQDIAQESFLKLWQNCAKVIREKAEGYVFMTANNRLLNEYNKQKVRLRFKQITHVDRTLEDPAFLLEHNEFAERLEKAISDLPEKQRIVFLMSRIDKKTYKEIASVLGISKQAVEKRIYNALDKLRHISKNIR